ncbi:MAG TPA: prepilin-type N-terminal cleavage/methylation domain-containing protein [Verrucomicrobiae bacterium]|jgi:Tfp pilus assembly protein FimT
MKLHLDNSSARTRSGISLIECMVYVSVLAILMGIALGVFYVCWGGFRAVISTTDDVSAALRAGERWRADVRGASGTISVENSTSGQTVNIPENGNQIVYSFNSDEVRRQVGPNGFSQLVLPKVKSSEMKSDVRSGVRAWQWELELRERPREPHLPMLFTFEAAQKSK